VEHLLLALGARRERAATAVCQWLLQRRIASSTKPRQTADPIHLMRLFGICDSTALKYIFAAHPQRQAEAIR
jgi:hypothetical protein